MSFYKKHVFICTNKKTENKPCCGNTNAEQMIVYAKQKAASLGLTKQTGFRVSSSGCMGRCSLGPVLAVYPAGDWYSYKDANDIDSIIQAIYENKTCAELALKDENGGLSI